MTRKLMTFSNLAVVLFLALATASSPAKAGTVTYAMTTSTPYLTSTPYTLASMSVPKFNLPGQCLTSVCVSLTTQAFGFVGLENYDN